MKNEAKIDRCRLILPAFVLLCQILCVGAAAQNLTFDGMVDDFTSLRNRPAAIHLMNGTILENVKVLSFSTDRRTTGVRVVKYLDGKRRVSKKASDIYQLSTNHRVYRFRFHGPTNSRFLIDTNTAQIQADTRLANQNAKLTAPLSAAEAESALADQKQFVTDSLRILQPTRFSENESEFCLVMTDYSPAATHQIATYVDQVCRRMNQLLGLPDRSNVWHGKAIIFAFSSQSDYGRFQSKVMNNDNYGNNTINYYNRPDKFVVSVRNKLPSNVLARRIIWSIVGGYIARYQSNVELPEWLRTGLREHLTEQLLPNAGETQQELTAVREELAQSGSLRGVLSATDIQRSRRRLTGVLVAYLIRESPNSFTQFSEDVKLGVPWEVALQSNYGLTTDRFVDGFGKWLGIPALTS